MGEKQNPRDNTRMDKMETGSEQKQERGIARRERVGSGTLDRSESRWGLGRSSASPFSMMRRMMEDMDRLFEEFTTGGSLMGSEPRSSSGVLGAGSLGSGMVFSPPVEVFQREGKLVVRADLPGLGREDVRVHLDEGGLVIEGERKSEQEENREGYYHSERSYGSFSRRIPLPRGIDAKTCDASFEDGVLEVKLELPKESRRQIEVRSGGGTRGAPTTTQSQTTQPTASGGGGETAGRNGPAAPQPSRH
jgi:HSP20 family protein